ncbi:hypothetical protein A4R27_26030 [Priestia endophytica]|nr:hypothetical protein A4R27_26030 [Priestia endophytica]
MTATQIYKMLNEEYGQPQWCSDNPYQVMAQAILMQNLNWSSVEKVTDALVGKMVPEYILGLETEELENLIRPCGFYKEKAAVIYYSKEG